MSAVAPVRRALGTRTIFNLLGPLSNPAGARRQLLGVYAARWAVPIAEVLKELGGEEALVVHGLEGLDEISISGPTLAARLHAGTVTSFEITPASFGLPASPPGSIQGGGAQDNRARLLGILSGERGAYRNAVVANAGAALWVAGLAEDLVGGARLAEQTLDSGAAQDALDRLVRISKRHGGPS
jgi:anthranilate phosphoribosyltransferase